MLMLILCIFARHCQTAGSDIGGDDVDGVGAHMQMKLNV